MTDTFLDQISIASPCKADWNEMVGDDRSRFCQACQLNVYNLSGVNLDEAEALISGAEGRLCVRFFRRADGTVLTQDCPVGLKALHRRKHLRISSIAAAVTVITAIGVFTTSVKAEPFMGDTASTTGAVAIVGGMLPPQYLPSTPPADPNSQPVDPQAQPVQNDGDSTQNTPMMGEPVMLTREKMGRIKLPDPPPAPTPPQTPCPINKDGSE